MVFEVRGVEDLPQIAEDLRAVRLGQTQHVFDVI